MTSEKSNKLDVKSQMSKSTVLFDENEEPSNWQIFSKFMSLSSVILLTSVAFFLVLTTDQIIVGHLGDADKIAGIGISTATINLCTLGISIGINKALDVLVTQAYGRGDLVLCGHYLNRGRFISLAILVPVATLLFIFAEQVTRIFTRDENVIVYGAAYLRVMMPAIIL